MYLSTWDKGILIISNNWIYNKSMYSFNIYCSYVIVCFLDEKVLEVLMKYEMWNFRKGGNLGMVLESFANVSSIADNDCNSNDPEQRSISDVNVRIVVSVKTRRRIIKQAGTHWITGENSRNYMQIAAVFTVAPRKKNSNALHIHDYILAVDAALPYQRTRKCRRAAGCRWFSMKYENRSASQSARGVWKSRLLLSDDSGADSRIRLRHWHLQDARLKDVISRAKKTRGSD